MRLSSHLRPYPRRPLYKSRPLSNLASTTVTAPRFPSPSLSRLRQHTGIATSAFTRHSQMFASTRTLTLEAQDLSKSPAMSGPSPKVTLEEDAKLWKFVSAAGNVPAHHIYDAPIQKSESDDREYRIIRLDNGLEALLVHDSTTDKSAASMDVAVGHLSDPDDIPGLAHFCEHMLFLGTEQFPKENEYSEYLAKNSGGSNAYTAADTTNYYFSVASDAFSGALKRFSCFFHSPLFSPSCTLRELNAVDSENKKNLQIDSWRIFQLNKHLTRPGHPWKKFGTGNKKTLTASARKARNGSNGFLSAPSPIPSRVASPAPSVSSASSEGEADGGFVGRETRKRLIEWWTKEYCASRMTLAVVGKESLDELTAIVLENFSPIENRNCEPRPEIPQHPFGEEERGSMIYAKSILDFHAFEISFPLPYQAPFWRSKPASFLAHFVGHEGPGSLHAYLKNKGWITQLSAGEQELARGFAMFKCTVQMTKEGFDNHREAIQACYKYFSLLRDSVFKIEDFNEIRDISALSFRFREKGSAEHYATGLSGMMKRPIPRSLLLSGQRLHWDWDPELIRDTLSHLTVENSRVFVISKDPKMDEIAGPWSSEPWYGTQYVAKRLDEEMLKAARKPNDVPELHLPGQNLFIPSNVDVHKKPVDEPSKQPSLIKDSPLMECWHKKDDQYWIPKAQVKIIAKSPIIGQNARSIVMTRLYVELVKDALNEYAYDAELAGLHYNVNGSQMHLSVALDGYNDKLPVLAQAVLEKLRGLEILDERFQIIKEEVKRDWENFFLGQPYSLSEYYCKFLLTDMGFTQQQKLDELSSITSDDLRGFQKSLFSAGFKYQMLVNGNAEKHDALKIATLVETTLSSQKLSIEQVPVDRTRLLPEGSNNIWDITCPNPNQLNGSLSFYCHVGNVADDQVRPTAKLLSQILSEPAFNILRTQEQLGYIVFCSNWQSIESIGIRIVVQGDKIPQYLESRVEAFLVHMRGILESMSSEEFEEQKRGLVRKFLEKLKKLSDESSRFWTHISTGYLDFRRMERDAQTLANITKDDVLKMFRMHLDPSSPTRQKVSVHIRPQQTPALKLSASAAQAFVVVLREAGYEIGDEEYNAHCSEDPTVASVKEHFDGPLRERLGSKADEVFQKLDDLVQVYPAAGQGAVEIDPKAVILDDGLAFRDSLKLSGTARPVANFESFVSKY